MTDVLPKTVLILGEALLLTCLLEAIPALCVRPRKKRFFVSLLGNVLTNPFLNLLLWLLTCLGAGTALRLAAALILEAGAVFAEACLYRLLAGDGRKKALLFSVGANVFSVLTGLLIFS